MSNAPISGIDSNSIARFIGRNADYYVQAWRALEIKKSMVSWNWPAFCFGPFWLAYRKMYLYTVLLFILGYGVDLILKFETVAGIVGAVAQAVLMGVFGNAIYRKHVTGEVALIEATHKEEADRAVAMGGAVAQPFFQ